MDLIEKAYIFAEQAHGTQKYGDFPYVYHLQEVANIAIDLGYNETIIISCILHDVLEDTSVSYNDLKKHFGEQVAETVYCVTDEIGRNRKERKSKTYPKIKSNKNAVIVKLCDRIANVYNSKINNQSLFEMYKNEHTDFMYHLYSIEDKETFKAWDKLNLLMK